jgi:hypothetical protein
MKTYKVLSIDAWADGEEEDSINWTWNNWFNFGSYNEEENGNLTETNALKYFEGLLSNPEDIIKYELDDDQCNLVLVRRSDRMPILAIEYGNLQ